MIYFLCKTFITYLCYKYLLSLDILISYLVLFNDQNFLIHTEEFINLFLLQLVLFVSSLEKTFPTSRSWRKSLVWSFRNFVLSYLACLLVHLLSHFCWNWSLCMVPSSGGDSYLLFMLAIQRVPHNLLKRILLCGITFIINHVATNMGVCFWSSLLFHWPITSPVDTLLYDWVLSLVLRSRTARLLPYCSCSGTTLLFTAFPCGGASSPTVTLSENKAFLSTFPIPRLYFISHLCPLVGTPRTVLNRTGAEAGVLGSLPMSKTGCPYSTTPAWQSLLLLLFVIPFIRQRFLSILNFLRIFRMTRFWL